MSLSAEAKLRELRGKTNRQLLSLIVNQLDRGMALARVAEGGSPDAEKALDDATAWMTMLHGVSEIERRRLEVKAAQLRSSIDLARACELKAHAAC